jgi:Cdc6-like AAA superfamily ATPase
MVYKLIPIIFKPVLYKSYEDQNESLINFCGKYIFNKSFISFDDIYENNSIDDNKRIKINLNINISQAQKTGNKCFLIYGPKGCGKTLYVHAIANMLGAKIAQIEGVELFKIPFFSREFIKASFGSMQFKPLIIYMKNIEQMFSTLNNFNYIYDKVASSYELNVYFFASSSINVYNLPRQISDKFHFFNVLNQLIKIIEMNILNLLVRKLELK